MGNRLKVLVGCEFSGVVRDAFIRAGHDARSCDLLPCESPGPHYQCDVLDILKHEYWDLAIFHPPCQYLCNSGVRWLKSDPTRWAKMEKAAQFYRALWDAPIERVAIENPIMHGFARRHIQIETKQHFVQPWWFGEGEIKATGFDLRGLPQLVPTDIVEGREPRVHRASPGPDRWKERSRTLPGIAKAMAEQWGSL